MLINHHAADADLSANTHQNIIFCEGSGTLRRTSSTQAQEKLRFVDPILALDIALQVQVIMIPTIMHPVHLILDYRVQWLIKVFIPH